jgi:hypothetical protein
MMQSAPVLEYGPLGMGWAEAFLSMAGAHEAH